MILRRVLLLLLLASAGCATADRSGTSAVSGAYVSGAGGWHP